MVLDKLSVPRRPTNLDISRARAYWVCSRCGRGLLDFFSLAYLFSFFSPSVGDGPIWSEILSQRAVKPQKTSQPYPFVSGTITSVYSCYHIYSKVSDKNACRTINSDLTTDFTISDSILRRFVVV